MKFSISFKTTFVFFLAVFTLNLEANPTFARQYDMSCSACHSQVPALNDMGLSFLRNGLRTSKYDPTTVSSLLDSNSSKRHYPIGAMIGLSDSSNSDEMEKMVKLYLSGTLTDSLSFMASTKESFTDDKEDQKLFTSNNSQLYFQYNFSEAKHVFRVGLFSPWTQLGNVKRSMSHSGLHGGEGHGNNYFSPLQHANVKQIKGAEYSYLSDNNLLFLFSYGETIENSSDGENNQNSHGNDNKNKHDDLLEDKSEHAFLTAMHYTTATNYKIGLIFNYTEMERDNHYAFILPIEKEYSIVTWNSSLVYANDSSDDYFGLETAFTFPLRDMEHVKAIVNVDRDENDNTNFAYSLGYTKIYKMFSFGIVAGHIDTDEYSDTRLMGSVQLIF